MAMPRRDGATSLTTRPSISSVPEEMVSSPEMQRKKRGLAAARRADKDDEFARLDVEIDVLEDLDLPIALVEIGDFEVSHSSSPGVPLPFVPLRLAPLASPVPIYAPRR